MIASLVLRTSSLPQTLPTTDNTYASNSTGAVNRYRTRVTFFNIDTEKVFGPLYREYDYFNLRLVNFSQAVLPSTYATNFRANTINVSGLPWIGCNYSTQYSSNINETSIGPLALTVNIANSYIFDSNGCAATFSKPPANFDLQITIRDVAFDSFEGNGRDADDILPNYTLMFDIVGVKL